ncbi:NAD(P)H-dependent oxidoreductase [uncultured Campylobacter sp.]|uniref:NAD(P)H-dependent oxidoreductase n=1 Tax=uncultured Campylobacter sp. TaxID=218934 RepID=UPI00261EE78A|nr:NAD(P)H-dependent oxidoreductase [uncultured Campylobacter sp.]
MKQICVILAHPYEKSLNAAIANAAVEKLQNSGYEVKFHDLYKEKFNPILSGTELVSDESDDELLKAHQKDIANAHGIVIVHPNWWGEPPAILKGWIDRVLRQRVAYDFAPGDNGGGLPIGLLKAKAAVVFNTSNTPEARENEIFGDPLERIWKSCIFDFCGVKTFERLMFRVVADSDEVERKVLVRAGSADAG